MEKEYQELKDKLKDFKSFAMFYNTLPDLLSSVSVSDWWRMALAIDQEGVDRLFDLMPDVYYSTSEEFILSIQKKYMNKKESSREWHTLLDEDESIIKNMLPPNSGLSRFFRRKGKSRYNDQDRFEHLLLDLWIYIRELLNLDKNSVTIEATNISVQLQLLFRNLNEVGYRSGAFYNFLINSGRYFAEISDSQEQKAHKFTLSDVPSIIENMQNKEYDFDALNGNVDEGAYNFLSCFCSSLKDCGDSISINNQSFIDTFFACLNSDLLGIDSMVIVDKLSMESFSTYIQQNYDLYCIRHPGLTRNYVFSDTIHTILKNEDLAWNGRKSSSCFNLPWTTFRIQKMYDRLINKYIDSETDIRIFGYLLTGYYPTSISAKKVACKSIVWINKEKQSAALFLGELKKRDERGSNLNYS